MLKWQSIGFHFSALKFSYTFHSPGTNALHFVIVTRNEFSQFTNNIADLKKINMLQVRSKLDQSAVLWHCGLTVKNRNDLERVQKAAMRVILGEKYIRYKNVLNVTKIESLKVRRQNLCLKFVQVYKK